VKIGCGAADGTDVSQLRRVGYQMVFVSLVLFWAWCWHMLHLGVLQNDEARSGDSPRTNCRSPLCILGLDSTVTVDRRVLCLETQ
jgi:hypothetical protein